MPFLSSTGVSLQSRSARIWLGASRPREVASTRGTRAAPPGRALPASPTDCSRHWLLQPQCHGRTPSRRVPSMAGQRLPRRREVGGGSHDRRFAFGRMGAAVSARATSKRPLGAAGCGATPRGLGPHRHELWRRTRPAGLGPTSPQEPGHEASVGSVADADDGTSPGGGRGLAREHPRGVLAPAHSYSPPAPDETQRRSHHDTLRSVTSPSAFGTQGSKSLRNGSPPRSASGRSR